MDDLNYDYRDIDEIINGKTYYRSVGPTAHAILQMRLLFKFNDFFKQYGSKYKVFASRFGIYLEGKNSENYVVPDVVIIDDCNKFSDRGYEGVPVLIIEILTPETAERDRMDKLELYQRIGVKEYWIISTGDKTIEQMVLIDDTYKLINLSFVLEDIIYKSTYLSDEAKAGYAKITPYMFKDLTIDLKEIFKPL